MIYASLNRLNDNDPIQTLGHFVVYENYEVLLDLRAVELPDNGNKFRVSRIPARWYWCELRYSTKYGWHFHVLDVEDRTWILIHIGNYYTDTTGCIIVGNNFADINKDGHIDVTSSGKTMRRLLEVMPKRFKLFIQDLDI
tara:strand:+ start:4050 stop:4469 length:420 start_codon:yes stop_codon:yes gene_type:complete